MKRTGAKFLGKLMAIAAFVCVITMFASCDNAADSGGGNSLSADEQKIVGTWLNTASQAQIGYKFNVDKTVVQITAGVSQQLPGATWSATDTKVTISAGYSTIEFTVNGNTITQNGTSGIVTYTKQ